MVRIKSTEIRRKPKLKICMIKSSNSGSNSSVLYKQMPSYIKEKYEVTLVQNRAFTPEDAEIHQNDVFITTHGEYPTVKDKVNIELWHGFPLKGMANMDPGEQTSSQFISRHWTHIDLIASYSPLYNTLFNACMGNRISHYRITGMPRNDMLFNSDSELKLRGFFQNKIPHDHKIIFFMPTFRKAHYSLERSEGHKDWANMFGYDEFNYETFGSFLAANKLTFVVKLHPFEESRVKGYVDKLENNGIYLLTNAMLESNDADLYEVLGGSQLLITDYSSVYFDYLLTDKPMVFTPADVASYRQSRGFLLEPYEFWTPGPKTYKQSDLEHEIIRSLQDSQYYEHERQLIKSMVHTFHDNLASERLWHTIDEYLEQHYLEKKQAREKQIEFDQLKVTLKKHISDFIESGKLTEAQDTIEEYIKIAGDGDVDIMCMQAIIDYVEGRSILAIETLTLAHMIQKDHVDVLYNLAFIYEGVGNTQSALHYYQLTLRYCTDPQLIASIQSSLAVLQNNQISR
ncbi:CDP-glycerol glycerophosphotransferase family protein [Bacillus sp. 3255]|uniref:CDP-glycerol glycerophosphotransferase family protein n=1 Tax=Bacillus sp. 3255 TaxID=2817904 RepID=UPI002858C650|nr:CDP-glycerol glycerophosphotransferase family protein [Bacillus sp. 3255]MDR6883463.1 CDP-glycerol glycerophosphotransferase (TagB/SpsB family) [Bacillus sp. 3255]